MAVISDTKPCPWSFPQAVIGLLIVFHFGINDGFPLHLQGQCFVYTIGRCMLLSPVQH